MLVRSAGRRQRQRNARIIAANFAQLQLPWLAPSQARWAATHTATASKRQNTSTPSQARDQRRQLATATDSHSPSLNNHFIPASYASRRDDFDDKSGSRWAATSDYSRSQDPYGQPPKQHSIPSDAGLFSIQSGINGSFHELLQHLLISIRIGRTARAKSIVARLIEQTSPLAPEVVYAHTTYLTNMLLKIEDHARGSPQALELFEEMEDWMKTMVIGQNAQSDRQLITMLKAAIRALPDQRRDDALRKYTTQARGFSESLFEDIVNSEMLDDTEYLVVSHVVATMPGEDSFMDDVDESDLLLAFEDLAKHDQPSVDEPAAPADSTNHVTSSLPEVRPVERGSQGLAGIKTVLEAFTKAPRAPDDATEQEKEARNLERQRILEETAVSTAIERWKQSDQDLRKLGINTSLQSKPLGALMWQWHQALLASLKQELVEVKKTLDSSQNGTNNLPRRTYGPYLESLSLDKLAAVTILQVMVGLTGRPVEGQDTLAKIGPMALSIGENVRQEAIVEAVKQQYKRKKMSTSQSSRFGKSILRRLRSKNPVKASSWETQFRIDWPKPVVVKLGAMLLSKLMETAQMTITREHPRTGQMVTQLQPAFLYRIKWTLGRKLGIMVANDALIDKLKNEQTGDWLAKRMPMLVKPKPWTGWTEGGYLYHPAPVARTGNDDGSCRNYMLAALDNGDLKPVLSGLDALGQVAWRVNEDVLRVQLEAWNSGEPLGNFAPAVYRAVLPPEPDATSDVTTRRKWLRVVGEIENRRSAARSLRCFQNFQLEIARGMAGETLYFPHNMDFRGRAYPISPYFNHMGADNARALLTFAEGKRLGEAGLRWLKIHLATVAGFDKASLQERHDFTMEHLDDIYDSARKPLEGNKWWLKSDDAWQTLAACIELTRALDSPEPTEYVSCLPVHQDGTCNGLQHYAALGGDEVGAKQVNLEPGDRPSDVYTAVAEEVRALVDADAPTKELARKVQGKITRKLVKQPVMTNVYGVTFYGARQQVYGQLLDILEAEDPGKGSVETKNEAKEMAAYIAAKIFKSLGNMFGGAGAIQDWLEESALRISTTVTVQQIELLSKATKQVVDIPELAKSGRKSQSKAAKAAREEVASGLAGILGKRPKHMRGHSQTALFDALRNGLLFRSPVVWTTPLGLPIAQPYRATKGELVKTNLQTIAIMQPNVWQPVNKKKQIQSFPPNFIHSLDATHMVMSANKAVERGIHFASIHDSFWTHACDVDTLSTLLRDAFVEIHSDDVIARLRDEFMTRHAGGMYLKTVMTTPAVTEQLSISRKKINKRGAIELLEEVERIRLLNSKDPAERQAGTDMVTPASVVAAAEAQLIASQADDETKGSARLGEIPDRKKSASVDAHRDVGAASDEAHFDVDDLELPASNDDPDAIELSDSATQDADDLEIDLEAELPADTPPEPSRQAQRLSDSRKGRLVDASSRYVKVQVWVPIEFPELPKKGTFDVSRLRESKYFFH